MHVQHLPREEFCGEVGKEGLDFQSLGLEEAEEGRLLGLAAAEEFGGG